ncbi:LIV-I protein H [Thalassovita gelatinovora]|uniref:LIV-I protein H n=1 Tax=Thalassovita gelatinovora TaxID=53501 RepID=A0A0P1FAR5_THAGE|nr:urea ABC transporter permease subunit UrtB [Thalassovita gelatinovora]QIZ80660.1 urea ABC transporter permease subunit UrtB [Thalassovita gelatinovora]CUH65222.1 LIV-I protein H [Thalassovita gelatinovora]SEQ87735.1 amino acid/amide ABC transporter membrane protein 1, HAAT family [Thalassovita gelatinovora]
MRQLLILFSAVILLALPAQAGPVQDILQDHSALITKSSRKTIQPAIDALANSNLPQAQIVLQTWQGKDMWLRIEDGLFFRGNTLPSKAIQLIDFDSGEAAGEADKKALKQLKPNSGVRALIGTALVQFQLIDPDPARRAEALAAIERAPDASTLLPLRASIEGETDLGLKARKIRTERLQTISFDPDEAARIAALDAIKGDLGVDVRAALNPVLTTKRMVFAGDPPADMNIARRLKPGADELTDKQAYDLIVAANLGAPRLTPDALRTAMVNNAADGMVGGVPVAELNTQAARERAYAGLVTAGVVAAAVTDAEAAKAVRAHRFVDVYDEPSQAVTDAASATLDAIETKVALNQALDLGLDALSLGSIYFLAAIGLAITFGVMGVINMAHGEFIMMGAYTGYVVQQIIPNYTVSIIVAIPMAFVVTFAAGVAMERLVIRWLYSRPLETLLATFGISIALQQIAKNIFGTQARPLTSPGWLDGAWVLNDVVSISYIRIAIFVLALIFLGFFLFLMKKTRLGLETRAVTQNPRMAASMGINPDRVNMLTFGLGSGIAGIAGVAIGLYAKVTSELGADYIVQSFMTVVVGGVGNIWGTLLGAGMIGGLQKGIEWLNPSNTLAAQTYMIIFIIVFIQFRPRGIIALKGRAAGD